MDREEPRDDESDHRPHGPAKLVLRAIDGGIHALQRLRGRFEPPAEEVEDNRRGRRGPAEEARPPAAARPGRPTLLHRLLVTTMCLLIGAAAGSWFSYRLLGGLAQSREAALESLQEDLKQARKDESIAHKAQERCLRRNDEHWKQLKEAEQEAEDRQARIAALEAEVAALKAVQRPPPVRSAAGSAATRLRPSPPPKTGSCVTGTAGAAGNVAECLEKFNRP